MCIRRSERKDANAGLCIDSSSSIVVVRAEPTTTNQFEQQNSTESLPEWMMSKRTQFRQVKCWRLPHGYSQSKFGGRRSPSTACTFIALAVTQNFYENHIELPVIDDDIQRMILPEDILFAFGNAIIDGNTNHRQAMKKRSIFKRLAPTFTIPDAIAANGNVAYEIDFRSAIPFSSAALAIHIALAIKNTKLSDLPMLYFLIIATQRCMSLVYDRNNKSIAVIDSHSHRRGEDTGPVISMASTDYMAEFIIHLAEEYFPDLPCDGKCMCEISLVHFVQEEKGQEVERRKIRVFRPHRTASAA